MKNIFDPVSFVYKKIEDMDTSLFKKKVPIRILPCDTDMPTLLLSFTTYQNFLRFFISDSYEIYRNPLESFCSDTLQNEDTMKHHLIASAAHEVRHRFQILDKKSIIPINFFETHKDMPLIHSAIQETERRGYASNYLRQLELDANLIESLFSTSSTHRNFNTIEVLSVNSSDILTLIKKLNLDF